MTIDEFKATIPEKEKRSRHFVEIRGVGDPYVSDLLGGFASKESANRWINSLGDNILWRVGVLVSLKQPRLIVEIVNKERESLNT